MSEAQPVEMAFTVPGNPRGQGRPRARGFTTKDGKQAISLYKDGKDRDYEMAILTAYLAAMKGKKAPARDSYAYVAMGLTAYFVVPKSWPKWRREAVNGMPVYHISRPDLTNIEKAVEDALEGHAYHNDSVIAANVGLKLYTLRESRLLVTLTYYPVRERRT